MSGGHAGATRPGERVVGPLDRLPPEAKLLGLLGFLLVTAVTPPGRVGVLLAQGAVAVTVAVVACVETRAILRRLLLDVPLLVLALTYAVAGHGRRSTVLGLSLSEPGLQVGLALLAKATIGIVAVSAMAASTPVEEVVAGLRRLHLPGWFCDLVGLSARQAGVLAADVERLRLAASVRLGGRGRRAEWSAVAQALGASFVRATERVDRLQLAAQARGGTTLGALVVPAPGLPDLPGRSGPVSPALPGRSGPGLAAARVGAWVQVALPAIGALAARLVP